MQNNIFTHPSLPKAILPGSLAKATESLRTKKAGANMHPNISISLS